MAKAVQDVERFSECFETAEANLKTISEFIPKVITGGHSSLLKIQQNTRMFFKNKKDINSKQVTNSFLELIEIVNFIYDEPPDSEVLKNLLITPYFRKKGLKPEDKCRGVEMAINWLTGAWFGLYFLGVPFPHPWEKVRLLSDDFGGLPTLPCLRKAFGDIYRTARQIHFREFKKFDPHVDENAEQKNKDTEKRLKECLFVLSETPLILKKTLPDQAKEDKRYMPEGLSAIAYRYALLQLRLYISCGLPLTYIVSDRVYNSLLVNKKTGEKSGTTEADIKKWLFEIFEINSIGENGINKTTIYNNQRVILVEDCECEKMPISCALGPKTGIYAIEAKKLEDDSENHIPFAGTYVWNPPLLLSYRKQLHELESKGINLLDKEKSWPDPKEKLKEFVKQKNLAANDTSRSSSN